MIFNVIYKIRYHVLYTKDRKCFQKFEYKYNYIWDGQNVWNKIRLKYIMYIYTYNVMDEVYLDNLKFVTITYWKNYNI